MNVWMRGRCGVLDRVPGGVDVGHVGPGQAGDHRTLDRAGDLLDRLEVARRGDREAGLDHVDAQPRELLRDLQLLLRVQRDAGRLLAVAQRRVEDQYSVGVLRSGSCHSSDVSNLASSRCWFRGYVRPPARYSPRGGGEEVESRGGAPSSDSLASRASARWHARTGALRNTCPAWREAPTRVAAISRASPRRLAGIVGVELPGACYSAGRSVAVRDRRHLSRRPPRPRPRRLAEGAVARRAVGAASSSPRLPSAAPRAAGTASSDSAGGRDLGTAASAPPASRAGDGSARARRAGAPSWPGRVGSASMHAVQRRADERPRARAHEARARPRVAAVAAAERPWRRRWIGRSRATTPRVAGARRDARCSTVAGRRHRRAPRARSAAMRLHRRRHHGRTPRSWHGPPRQRVAGVVKRGPEPRRTERDGAPGDEPVAGDDLLDHRAAGPARRW